MPRHGRLRMRLALFFGVLDHFAGNVCDDFEDAAGKKIGVFVKLCG